MLGWDLSELNIERDGGVANPFRFVITFSSGSGSDSESSISGEGVILRSGSVHFHHEDELRRIVSSLGMNAENFLDYLADVVSSRSTQGPTARA